MSSKFRELMGNYGKIKQFPISDQLPPLSEEQAPGNAREAEEPVPQTSGSVPQERKIREYRRAIPIIDKFKE